MILSILLRHIFTTKFETFVTSSYSSISFELTISYLSRVTEGRDTTRSLPVVLISSSILPGTRVQHGSCVITRESGGKYHTTRVLCETLPLSWLMISLTLIRSYSKTITLTLTITRGRWRALEHEKKRQRGEERRETNTERASQRVYHNQTSICVRRE